MKHLKRLNLRNCTSLTDSAMKKISSAEFTLEFLSIGECFRITGKGIESLVFGQTMLEELCISGIRNLSVTLLECIIQSCPFLRVLNSTAMQGIRMEEYEVFWNRWVSTCELTGEMDFLSSGKWQFSKLWTLIRSDCSFVASRRYVVIWNEMFIMFREIVNVLPLWTIYMTVNNFVVLV